MNHPLMSNNITRDDLNVLVEFLNQEPAPILTNSKKVLEFEKLWSEWLGIKYSIFVNSGSSANQLTMLILKYLKTKKEIIVPPLTWVSDIASVLQNNFTPVFCDINLKTLALDENEIEKKITKNTGAVFLTHILGYNGLTNKILELANKHNIPIIEDCCEAHGATFNGKKIGSFGLISNFSFYYAHHMSVSPKTSIPHIDENNEFRLDSIENIYNKHFNNPQKIKIVSFDETNTCSFTSPSNILKHKFENKEIFELKLKGNKTVEITEDHSVFVWNPYKLIIEAKPTNQLNINDLVAVPKSLPKFENKIKEFDLISFFKQNNINRYSIINYDPINLNNIKGEYKSKLLRLKENCRYRKVIPLEYISTLTGMEKIGVKKQKKSHYIPYKMTITPELCAVLGFFIAEGSYKNNGIIFSFHKKETEYTKFISDYFTSTLGLESNIHTKGNSMSLSIDNSIVKDIFQFIFKIHSGCKNKRIPNFIFGLPDEYKIAYLYGHFSGDGCFHGRRSCISSAGRDLINDVSYLCYSLGIETSIYGDEFFHEKLKILNKETEHGCVYGLSINGLEFNKSWKIIKKDKTYHNCKYANDHNILKITIFDEKRNKIIKKSLMKIDDGISHSIKYLKTGDITLCKIKSIKKIIPSYEYVYDFSVPINENFIGGWQPICLHNSSIEGGMVCTNDETIYQLARMFRSHGMLRESADDFLKNTIQAKHYDLNKDFIFVAPAYNFRSTEINAVIAINQLKRLDENNSKRKENLNIFLDNLNKDLYYTNFNREGNSNYAFTLLLKNKNFILRDFIEKTLNENGIEFRRGMSGGGNQLRQPYLKELYNDEYKNYPNVDYIHNFGWYIGNYPDLEKNKIIKLCNILNKI